MASHASLNLYNTTSQLADWSWQSDPFASQCDPQDTQPQNTDTSLYADKALVKLDSFSHWRKQSIKPYPDHMKRLHRDLVMMKSRWRWITPCGVDATWRHILDVIVSGKTRSIGWIHRHVCDMRYLIRCGLWPGKMPLFFVN